MIGLYDPTCTRNIDRALAALPPDLKKFASGLDYRPLQLKMDEPEAPSGLGGEDSNVAKEELEKEAAKDAQLSSSSPLEIKVSSPAGSHPSEQAPFAPAGQVATETVAWILRSAGLRV